MVNPFRLDLYDDLTSRGKLAIIHITQVVTLQVTVIAAVLFK